MSAAKIELPEGLTEDMEVLFINPYSPGDSRYLQMAGASDRELMQIYNQAAARDPGFQKFEDKVGLLKTMLGLGGYCLGDDLIILYGDKSALEKVQDSLKDEYTCFFDTIGAFLKHCESEDAVVTIEERKPLLN